MKMAKKRFIYTSIVTLIIVFSTTYAILTTLESRDYRNYLQGEYSKNMYQLIDAVRNIKTELAKSAVVGSREQGIVVFENIFRYSTIANDKIHSLPIPQPDIEGTSRFLSKVGDYAYALVKSSTQGKDLSEQEYKNIEELKNQSDFLLIQLTEAQQDINEGNVKWGEIRKKASKALEGNSEKLVTGLFNTIEKQVVQYPALIYDGPFSDNVLDVKPRILSEKTISEEAAKTKIRNLFGADKIKNITKKEEVKTRVPGYDFNITLNGREEGEEIVCSISKNGGKIIYLLDNKNVSNTEKYDTKKASQIGVEYLEKLGYRNMKSTYSVQYDNVVTVSYVYQQNDISIYTDQVKLKIALDDGTIVGVEAEKYLVAHREQRDMPKPKITEAEARSKVGRNLKISSTALVIVPTETDNEVLCYEFVGKYNDDDFVVYINAETGYEQKILQIINTPNGQLTM